MGQILSEEQGDNVLGGELTGQVIGGKYQLEHYIGSGSSGAVYSARHRVLEKTVALKILHPEMARSAELVELFKREARAASRIDHPNSVRVLDFGEDTSGLLYIVMEFVEGPDLLGVLEEDFPLEQARVVEIISQVLAALSLAHELGVVHRDLKPENILVLNGTSDEGKPTDLIKICDFGIAQLSPASVPLQAPRSSSERPSAIDVQALVGTPEYMSPEQARGEPLDARSDVYSAGVLLFQIVTGRLPFMAETPNMVATMQCSAQPPHPSWFKDVDPWFDPICLKAMSKDPKDRYQSAREMRSALRHLFLSPADARSSISSAPAPAPTTMRPPPSLPVGSTSQFRRHPVAFACFLLLGSGVAAAGYVWVAGNGDGIARGSALRGESSRGRSVTAIAERQPEPSVARSPSVGVVPAEAAALSVPRLVWSDSVPALGPVKSRETTLRSAERVGRTGQRPLPTLRAPAIPLPERASSSEPVAVVESTERAASDPLAGWPDPLASREQELIASAAVQSGSRDEPLVQPATNAPVHARAIVSSAKSTPASAKAEPLTAVARIQDVTVRGSLATSIVRRAMERARPRLSACYARTAKAAGRNGFGLMSVEVEFDERGRAHRSRADGGALPGLDRCVTEVAANLIATQAPDTGLASATWRVSFEP